MKILKDVKSATGRRMKRLALSIGVVPLAVGSLAIVGAELTTQSSASAATVIGLNVSGVAWGGSGNFTLSVPLGAGVGIAGREIIPVMPHTVKLQAYGWPTERVVGYVCNTTLSAADQACLNSAGLNGGWNIWPQYANNGTTSVWLWPNQALFANAQAYENGQWVSFSYAKILTVPPPT